MNAKQIRKHVLDEIYEGKSHQTIYDELNSRYPNREIDLARIVAGEVSMAQRQQYGTANIILIILLFISILLKVIFTITAFDYLDGITIFMAFVTPAINVFLLVGVVRWQLPAYRAVGVLAVLSFLKVFGFNITIQFDPMTLLSGALIGLGFYLYSRLGGKYKTNSQQYKDAKGQIRARHIIKFAD